MEKKIFARLGVTVTLTEDQFIRLKAADAEAAALIREKISQGDFVLEGETYFPVCNSPGNTEWTHSQDIEFYF